MYQIAFLLMIATLSTITFAQYEVRWLENEQHLSLSFTPPRDAGALKLAPRGVAWGLKSQVDDVRCGDDPLPRDVDGNWLAPADCTKVEWRVVPDVVPVDGVGASGQRTLAVGKLPWILLAEPTSILRPLGIDGAATIRSVPGTARFLGATQVESGVFRVPPVHGGPEFYVLGEAELSRRRFGQLEISYVADNAARVKELGLEALHASALRYLTKVTRFSRMTAQGDRSLVVVWLGVSESQGRAGGAAGSRSFLANYVLGSNSNHRRNLALTTMIIAHEQFHQLADILRSDLPPQPFPVWLNESIAHYYGLKALLVSDKSKYAKDFWDEFVDRDRVIESGLIELNHRYESGDPTVYPLFYSQGATFWNELDNVIQTATGGEKSLDHYLVELLCGSLESNGDLPASFVDRLRRVGGGSIDQVISRYVGN
jgi:hypothetical protein